MSKRKQKKILTFLLSLIIICSFIYKNIDNIKQSLGLNKQEEVNTLINDELKIYFLDVGQADSILIKNKNHNVLIDGGNNEDGPKLVNYFKSLNITKFDYVIGTHPHEDHIGGLDDIINEFNVENILLPEAYTTTKTFEDLLNAIENKNKEITVPKIKDKFTVGNANFEVIYVGENTSDLNNTSIVLKMTYGKTKYLFTGDATSSSEKKMLNSDIDVDVLKVGHHGSQYSTSEEFIKKTSPTYAIISVGKNNIYNHPSSQTINRIKNNNTQIFLTSEDGTILLTSDGEKININNIKTDTDG